MSRPRLSLVILTRNEERHVGDCLASLAEQTTRDFEAIVVDAASTDATVDRVRQAQDGFPVPLVLEAADRPLPIGEARNRGVELARADRVAFLSADARLEDSWIQRALDGLEAADVVYGRQVHQPPEDTPVAAVRSLRYHFPRTRTDEPERYASNVAAAYRREILERFPLQAGEDIVDDLLIARRAARAGARIAYDPDMVVHHHDVHTARQEWTKNSREGHAWGRHADELGLNTPVLAWAGALVAALVGTLLAPGPGAVGLAAVLFAPGLRRAIARRGDLPTSQLVAGTAASPPFDLAFMAAYLAGLGTHLAKRRDPSTPKEHQA